MRYMGIDYGTKKTGIAISDEEGNLAFPRAVLSTERNLAKEIVRIVKEEEVEKIVIGESVGFRGRANPIMKDIHTFKKVLAAKTGLPIYFQSEIFTSAEAKRYQKPHAQLDASAAALILQHYLDEHKRT